MADRRINLPVTVPPELRLGTFANGFRFSGDGGDVFLDFVCYSEQEQIASVVCRVRVHPAFLVDMRDRLVNSLQELQTTSPPPVVDLTPDKIN